MNNPITKTTYVTSVGEEYSTRELARVHASMFKALLACNGTIEIIGVNTNDIYEKLEITKDLDVFA